MATKMGVSDPVYKFHICTSLQFIYKSFGIFVQIKVTHFPNSCELFLVGSLLLPAFAFFWSKAQSHQGTKNDNRLLKFFWLNSRYTSSYLHLFTSPQIKLARFHLTATCDPCPPFPDQIFRFVIDRWKCYLEKCIIFSGGDQ